jgi:hypothetical protein
MGGKHSLALRTLAFLASFQLTACASIGDPSPSAGTSQTPSSATAKPTPAPTPTQAAEPTATTGPTPSQQPITGGWRVISEFPPAGANIAAIATFANGFVAVGTAGEPDYCDGSSAVDGQVWTSSDGSAWAAADVDLTGLEPRHVVVAGGVIHVFLCTSEEPFVARSADGVEWSVDRIGVDWYASGYTVSGDTLLAASDRYDDEGRFVASVWSSADGINWAPRTGSPETGLGLRDLTASGATVVATSYEGRPVFISLDSGQTWQQADYAPLYNADILAVAVSDGHFAAIGEACCTTPQGYVGFGIWSDGLDWLEAQPFGTRQVPDGVVALPNGFLGIAERSWLSSDGASWVIGPEIPGYERDRGYAPAIGAATSEAVVITDGGTAWLSATSALDPGLHSETPRIEQRPSVGSSYPYTTWTGCGWLPVHFDLRAWVPDPPINDFDRPPGLKRTDHGTLTYVSDEELRYVGELGRVIKLVPSDEPKPYFGCA